ncbi:hypothetical protein C4J97_0412 [Pseudomonas orientalis]|nr:hypothetical protein C4J97_0412 [Pseudomonas orientalis]
MANDGSTRAADKSGKKRWALKHFSPSGVIRTAQTSRPNARSPAAIRR